MQLPPLIQTFVLHFGEMGGRWGVNRTVGQIYALLFLSDRPLNAEQITESIDAVVYTAAVKEDNPEYVRAKELGIPLLSRAQLLGQIMTNYETAIAVSGTHGKTTTTSMISSILMKADADPTISVGGSCLSSEGISG